MHVPEMPLVWSKSFCLAIQHGMKLDGPFPLPTNRIVHHYVEQHVQEIVLHNCIKCNPGGLKAYINRTVDRWYDNLPNSIHNQWFILICWHNDVCEIFKVTRGQAIWWISKNVRHSIKLMRLVLLLKMYDSIKLEFCLQCFSRATDSALISWGFKILC